MKILDFCYLSSDIVRYSADFDADFMPARYFIWLETILNTYWISHYISKTFYASQDRLDTVHFVFVYWEDCESIP